MKDPTRDEIMITTLEQAGFTQPMVEALLFVFQTQKTKPKKQAAPKETGAIAELASVAGVERMAEVTHDLQRAWLVAYKDAAWISGEITRAAAWIVANPQRAPKKFGPFMNNWISRGWEKHRKTLPTNPGSKALVGSDAAEAYKRDLEEKYGG